MSGRRSAATLEISCPARASDSTREISAARGTVGSETVLFLIPRLPGHVALDPLAVLAEFGLAPEGLCVEARATELLQLALERGRLSGHDLGMLRLDVLAAVRRLERELETGTIRPGVRVVRGHALSHWLTLDDTARLIHAGDARRHTEAP